MSPAGALVIANRPVGPDLDRPPAGRHLLTGLHGAHAAVLTRHHLDAYARPRRRLADSLVVDADLVVVVGVEEDRELIPRLQGVL